MRLDNRGFSMIEIMVATIVLSLCTLAAFKVVGVVARTSQETSAAMATQPTMLRDTVSKFNDDFRTRTVNGGAAVTATNSNGAWTNIPAGGLLPCSDVTLRRNQRMLSGTTPVTVTEVVQYETICQPSAGTTEQPLSSELACTTGNAMVRITRTVNGTPTVETLPADSSVARGMAMCFRVDNARGEVQVETSSVYTNPAPSKSTAQLMRAVHMHKFRMTNPGGIEFVPPVENRQVAGSTNGNGNGNGSTYGNGGGNGSPHGNGGGNGSAHANSGH